MKRFSPASSASRREALFVVWFWVAACVFTLGYAALFAYGQDAAPRMLIGMPEWVVWGVLAPWLVSLVVTVWFAMSYMKDEPLGESSDEDLPVE